VQARFDVVERSPQSRSAAGLRTSGLTSDDLVRKWRTDVARRDRLASIDVEPARAAETAPLPEGLPASLVHALRSSGRDLLWTHQREAIDHALSGRNVCIATETSSGKSLCFQVPVLASVIANPAARALFLFPTNPLANDQEESLRSLLSRVPAHERPRGPVRLFGAMGAEKDRIAASDPQLVLTNPEMVHLHLLPQHRRWASFWAGLEYVVVDEIHLYRGAFGGHVAQLLRRIRRCAWRYGAKPRVIAASATVGNPRALAEELCSAPFELVDRSTAPRGPRTTVLWKTPENKRGERAPANDEAVSLFRQALELGLQTILFARSRQLVETLVRKLEDATGRSRISLGVRAYRGGYTREERETIEKGLRDGTVRGVVTTNALEVGIDIGSLDVCLTAGYPGSVMALRQQAGRVGRRDRPCAIVLVAGASPLDAWLVDHPEVLRAMPSEKAVVGRLNPHVLKAHLACAASEFPLWEAEIERLGADAARAAVATLEGEGLGRWTTEGDRRVFFVPGRPQGSVSLRSATQERWTLEDPDGESVGELDGAAVLREAHPGAIYLHQGRTFRVASLAEGRVKLVPAPVTNATRVQAERTVVPGVARKSTPLADGRTRATLGSVDVVDRYSSYLETTGPGRAPFAKQIEPPQHARLTTDGLVLELGRAVVDVLERSEIPLSSALHGAEHLLVAFGSTVALCDREDLEGHTLVPLPGDAESRPAAVLFDRWPGGMGFASAAFDALPDVLERAFVAVEKCPCAEGCPACVHGGRCLRGSEPLSKVGARLVLASLTGRNLEPVVVREAVKPVLARAAPAVRTAAPEKPEPVAIAASLTFSTGDRVEHAVFGEGLVLELRPSGRVVVQFADGKPRRITPGWLRRSSDIVVS